MRILGPHSRVRGWLPPGLLIPLAALLLAACGTQPNENPTSDAAAPNMFPGEVVTVQGTQAADLYLPIFIVAAVIFVLVEGLLIVSAVRFRRRPTDTELPAQTHGNNRLEILWTVLPAFIVTVMFVGSLMVLRDVEAKSDDPAVTVDVTAFQWQWTFDYKEQGLSYTGAGTDGPEMVVPVGEPVRVRLEAIDVIHSFFVPAFFTKRDAIPGRVNELEFTVDQPGTYGGQCAEFCGLSHADMFFTVRAVERAEFDAWLAAEMDKATATPTPPPPPPSGKPSPPPPPGSLIDVRTTAEAPLAYSTRSLSAEAGDSVTVTYTNDSKLAHNIAFFAGPDSTAPRIDATEIKPGPNVESVTFDAPDAPGAYFFHCDVHPVQMTGTFTVTP